MRNNKQRSIIIPDQDRATDHLVLGVSWILPVTLREIDISGYTALFQHRSYDQIVPKEEFIIYTKSLLIFRVKPPNWTVDRCAIDQCYN